MATDELNDDTEGFATSARARARKQREKDEAEEARNRPSNPLMLSSLLPTEEQRLAHQRGGSVGALFGNCAEALIDNEGPQKGGRHDAQGDEPTDNHRGMVAVGSQGKRVPNPSGDPACCAACRVS